MTTYQIFDNAQGGEQHWSWVLLDDKGNEVGRSKESLTKGEVIARIKQIRDEVASADVLHSKGQQGSNAPGLVFEYYEQDSVWSWELLHKGEEIARGTIPDEVFEGGDAKDFADIAEGWVKDIRDDMGKAKAEWKNPEDDPANPDKKDDNTPTKGIPGS